MIVEIQNIETDTLELVIAALDEINLGDLSGVFMRWAFCVEWREIDMISPDNERLVAKIMDAACTSYSYRFDDREFTKRKTDKELDPEPESGSFSSDEDAPDLQSPEKTEPAQVSVEALPVVHATVKLVTDQRGEVVGLMREYKMPELAEIVSRDSDRGEIPRPTDEQFMRLQEILELCQSYTVQIGDWSRSSA